AGRNRRASQNRCRGPQGRSAHAVGLHHQSLAPRATAERRLSQPRSALSAQRVAETARAVIAAAARRASPFGHGAPLAPSKKRVFLWGLALLAACLVAITAASQDRPRLIVYLQTQVRARALEAMLARQMPSVDVIVCGRYRDFTRELESSPEAALALPPVL